VFYRAREPRRRGIACVPPKVAKAAHEPPPGGQFDQSGQAFSFAGGTPATFDFDCRIVKRPGPADDEYHADKIIELVRNIGTVSPVDAERPTGSLR